MILMAIVVLMLVVGFCAVVVGIQRLSEHRTYWGKLVVIAGCATLIALPINLWRPVLHGNIRVPSQVLDIMALLAEPPADYHDDLVQLRIAEGAPLESTITHQYPGVHWVGIRFEEHAPRDMTRRAQLFPASITCRFLDGAQEVFTISSELGHTHQAGGRWLTIMHYEVPQDVPLRTALTVRVEVHGLSDDYLEAYSPVNIFIHRRVVL